MSANTHTRTRARTEAHTGRRARAVQADRTRNAPVNEIRFLGGFAVGTGLQSTAASGRGRLGWGAGGRRGDQSPVIKPPQRLC